MSRYSSSTCNFASAMLLNNCIVPVLLQMLSLDLFMLIVRPFLFVLVMMLSGIYIDAFSGEVAKAREGAPSVAGDLLGLVHDGLNRRDQRVREDSLLR